jgi:hypothetical protein
MFQLWFRSGIKIRKALESQIKGNDFTLQRKRALKFPTPLPMAVANSLRVA